MARHTGAGAGAARRGVQGGFGAAARLAAAGASRRTQPPVRVDVRCDDEGGAVCNYPAAVRPGRPRPAVVVGRAVDPDGTGIRRSRRAPGQYRGRHQGDPGGQHDRKCRAYRDRHWRRADRAGRRSAQPGGVGHGRSVAARTQSRGVQDAVVPVRRIGTARRRVARTGAAGRADPPHADYHRLRAGRRTGAGGLATRIRLCQRMDADPVGAGGATDRRTGFADPVRRHGLPGGDVCRPGCRCRGAADRRGVSGPAAHAARLRRGRSRNPNAGRPDRTGMAEPAARPAGRSDAAMDRPGAAADGRHGHDRAGRHSRCPAHIRHGRLRGAGDRDAAGPGTGFRAAGVAPLGRRRPPARSGLGLRLRRGTRLAAVWRPADPIWGRVFCPAGAARPGHCPAGRGRTRGRAAAGRHPPGKP